jgi:hypothetical protein
MLQRANSAFEDARTRRERIAELIFDDGRPVSSWAPAHSIHTRSREAHFTRATPATAKCGQVKSRSSRERADAPTTALPPVPFF